ncbi:MAG: SH3 domain-containing protein [Spirochaetes bacterium]|nr:SH3 domain-containing protein [Spirochaetota bacterium]MBX3723332.1 SH3 domain-containing protein [Turneriella sp.]
MRRIIFSGISVCIFTGVSLSAAEFTPKQVVYSTVNALRIRDTPSLEGKTIGSFVKGDSLRVIRVTGNAITVDEKTGRWVEFDFEGKKGYAFAGFLAADMPLLAHTETEWKKITARNARHSAQRIKEAEDWAKAHPDDQNCTPSSCYREPAFGYPKEYQKGCTARKLAAIKKLSADKGISLAEAVGEYGDGYCLGWVEREVIENNCSLGGDSMPAFPLR